MNVLEKEIIETLKYLRDECGCFQIKAEFEAEGTRMSELMRLKDITSSVGLPIIMKIGGVEAVYPVHASGGSCISPVDAGAGLFWTTSVSAAGAGSVA